MSVKDFNESHVDNFAHPQPTKQTLRVLREWMGKGNLTLDVGCGSGYYATLCRQSSNSVFGIDITNQVITARALGVDVCKGNVEHTLPFANNTFTQALCIEVVEHLLQPDLTVSEIFRVLKPGATLIVTTPNYSYWTLRLLYLFGQPPVGLPVRHFRGLRKRVNVQSAPPWRDPHIRLFNPFILAQMLTQSGFIVSSMRSTFVSFPSGLAPYLPWISGLPLRIVGKLLGNLNFLGDYYPSLLAAGLLCKATKE